MIPVVFPTILGIAPYKSKTSIPMFKLRVYDTPYTVKHLGCTTDFYVFPSFVAENVAFTAGNKKWSTTCPLLKWYTGKSWPFEISQYYHSGEQFGIHYHGKFKAGGTTATIHLRGNGWGNVTLNSVSLGTTRLNLASDVSKHFTGLTANSWYDLSIKYVSSSKYGDTDNVLVVLADDAQYPDKMVLTASKFTNGNDYVGGPSEITGTLTKYVANYELSQSKDQVSKLSFTVPIVSTTASLGYSYNNS